MGKLSIFMMNEVMSMKMTKVNTKKMVISGMMVAATVSLSGFSIPVGASRCFPVQHLCNVMAGVFLGPWYGVGMAFCTSLIRNLLGTGSLLAFPGEVFGTGILGALLCWPVAVYLMGREAALFAYVLPFLASTVCGTVMAAVIIGRRMDDKI